MDTTIYEIYEPQDGICFINNENANGDYSGSQNHFQTLPEHVSDTMKKYIEKLEQEIVVLKEEVESLRN